MLRAPPGAGAMIYNAPLARPSQHGEFEVKSPLVETTHQEPASSVLALRPRAGVAGYFFYWLPAGQLYTIFRSLSPNASQRVDAMAGSRTR